MRILDYKAKIRMHFVHLEALSLARNSVQVLETFGKVNFLLKFSTCTIDLKKNPRKFGSVYIHYLIARAADLVVAQLLWGGSTVLGSQIPFYSCILTTPGNS